MTGLIGENHVSPVPVALYGVVLLMSALAFTTLTMLLVRHEGRQSQLAKAIGRDFKGKVSRLIYSIAIPLAFYSPAASIALYVLVAAIWFIPDRRVERAMGKHE